MDRIDRSGSIRLKWTTMDRGRLNESNKPKWTKLAQIDLNATLIWFNRSIATIDVLCMFVSFDFTE